MALLLFGDGMELGELKVFLTVATERSFSRAAAKLYRTQPAVSQAVRRLEEQLGEKLFDRSTKSGALTPAGEVLFREGPRLLRLAEETAAAVRRQSEQERGTIRIGGDEAAVQTLLPAVAAFLAQRPSINLDLRRVSESDVVVDVAAGAIDVGAVTAQRVPSRFRQIQVVPSRPGLSVLVARDHPLAARPEATIVALHDERLILLSDPPHLYEQVTRLLAESGAAPASIVGMPGVDGIRRAVEMGLGIALVPAGCLSPATRADLLAAVRLADLEFSGTITLVYRDTDALSKSTLAFIQVVQDSLAAVVPARARVHGVAV